MRRLFLIVGLVSLHRISAQDVAPVPTGYELVNYGQGWNSLPNASKDWFIEGMVEGYNKTYWTLINFVPSQMRKEFEKKIYLFYDTDVLREVMTKLYADPANTYISYGAMAYIARDKLNGENIEDHLRYSRRKDRGYHSK